MAYATFDQSGEGTAAECRSWSASAPGCTSRSGAAVIARLRFVRASSLSLPGRSFPSRWARGSSRSHSGDYVEGSSAHGRTVAEVRQGQWLDHGSHRERRIGSISAPCKKAWLSRVPKAAHFKSTFPIRLIVCSSPSSHRPTTFWCPVASVQSVDG